MLLLTLTLTLTLTLILTLSINTRLTLRSSLKLARPGQEKHGQARVLKNLTTAVTYGFIQLGLFL